ncbi:MAG: chemotaxis response regulator protein-glutamate methylesterase [Coriobacteriia bacterium]|nr:chemotaxis response regulator protein-glutamate methylesterase [Coriobacteriia bacterium]
MRSTIRVLVVDDSALIRQMLTRALSVDPRIEIVGTAKTGVEAIERARDAAPDVITLDIEMPEMTGLEALPHIRRYSSARVVMLSSLDDPETTYQALSAGAVDFLCKPKTGMASSLSDLTETLLKKIRTAYRIDPHRLNRSNEPAAEEDGGESDEGAGARVSTESDAAAPSSIVAIAASTGGPPALERVLSGLSASIPAAYLIVQHLPVGFSMSLAKRLSTVSDVGVVEAVDMQPVRSGCAYLAPYGSHMRLGDAGGTPVIRLSDEPPMHGVRPAADPLFESVAVGYGERAVGVVLTGMGTDGAVGLKAIREAGGSTIVQNEETSVVWGMPGAAMRHGAAKHVVPIGLVAAEIRRCTRVGRPV